MRPVIGNETFDLQIVAIQGHVPMIETVADLLEQLVQREKAVLATQPDLNHMPMLGDMYEGLARNLLKRAVFKGLNLHVAEGKIRFPDRTLSGQIDCMIARGEGETLPHTSHRIYELPEVVAVVEVKKTLYGSELSDSFLHLREFSGKPMFDVRNFPLIADAWRSIMQQDYPSEPERRKLDVARDMIRVALVLEAHLPVRVVYGFDGFSSESELRKGFVRFLEKHVPEEGSTSPTLGFGVNAFPNMMISGNSFIVKANGMPYGMPVSPNGFWSFLASNSGNPFAMLLELLWTRLAYRFHLSSEIFGDDLKMDALNRFIDARWNTDGNGWEYRSLKLSAAKLAEEPNMIEWEPAFLTEPEFSVMNLLCNGKNIRLDDQELISALKNLGSSCSELSDSLRSKNLVYVKENQLCLLTTKCVCAILPGSGEFVAADDSTGRFSRWLRLYMDKQRPAEDVDERKTSGRTEDLRS